jgi:DNA polymerase (family 10)
MLRVPGLGPKKIRALWKKLEVADIAALAGACERGEVAQLAGFGAKSQEKILRGIDYLRSVAGRFLIPEVEGHARALLEHLRAGPPPGRLEVAGSYRRRNEVLKDLDLVASTGAPGEVAAHFRAFPGVGEVVASGSTKTSVRLVSGLAVDLRLVDEEQFPFALCHFTGSREHNTALRARARERGMKLNEYGLYRGSRALALRDEEEIYRALDLEYVPPELRENLGEVELAAAGALPHLVRQGDLRGVVHVHTNYSDGHETLEELVAAARERGYEYLGVADHSRSAFYAGGLEEADIRRQHREIDRLNARLEGFRIFKGIESDILADGSLDYGREVLESFDFVIASLHSRFAMPEEEMTRRVLRAMEDPHTTFLGHVTARLLLRRRGVALDMDRVLRAASELGVAVEINASPHRLDLDWRHGPRARELGLLTAINPDAHVAAGMDDVRYGVGIARKAGFSPERVVNTYGAEEFAEFCARRKRE